MKHLLLSLALVAGPAAAFGPPPDLDGDGRIDRGEWREGAAMRFRAADRNLDRRLDAAEQQLLQPRLSHIALHAGPPPMAGDCLRLPPRPAAPPLPRDLDGDGLLSAAEVEAEAGEQFTRLDRDGDGVLAGEEMLPPMP